MTRKNLSIFWTTLPTFSLRDAVKRTQKMEINASFVVLVVVLGLVIFVVWRQESLVTQMTSVEQLVTSIHPTRTIARETMRNSVWNEAFPLPQQQQDLEKTFIDTKKGASEK